MSPQFVDDFYGFSGFLGSESESNSFGSITHGSGLPLKKIFFNSSSPLLVVGAGGTVPWVFSVGAALSSSVGAVFFVKRSYAFTPTSDSP
jgi:hypothetical protein